MMRLTTLALVVLAGALAVGQLSSQAQQAQQAQRQPQPQSQNIELELLELEQDADKAILREALILQGRMGMKPAPDTQPEKRQFVEETAVLRDFIAEKKKVITARSAELADKRMAARRVPTGARVNQPPEGDRQAAIEKYERSRIEVQLLQAQVTLLQSPLEEAVQALAKAELAASNDESERPKAEAARKEYEKIKAMVVELNKRLHLEQQSMQPLQMRMGGIGGGFQ